MQEPSKNKDTPLVNRIKDILFIFRKNHYTYMLGSPSYGKIRYGISEFDFFIEVENFFRDGFNDTGRIERMDIYHPELIIRIDTQGKTLLRSGFSSYHDYIIGYEVDYVGKLEVLDEIQAYLVLIA
jgi:hypothetical protein